MKRALLFLLVVGLYALHQDFWNWAEVHPLVFGVFPIGLFYHIGYSVSAALLMWLLVSWVWPASLERESAKPDRPVGLVE